MLKRLLLIIFFVFSLNVVSQIKSDIMVSDTGKYPFFDFDKNNNIHLIWGYGFAKYSVLNSSCEQLFEKVEMGSKYYNAYYPSLVIKGDTAVCIWESMHKAPFVDFSSYIKAQILHNGQAISEEILVDDADLIPNDAHRQHPVLIWHNDTTLFAVWHGLGSRSFTVKNDIYFKKLFLNPFRRAGDGLDRIIDNSKLYQDELNPSIIKKHNSDGYLIIRNELDSLSYWNFTGVYCSDSLVPESRLIYVQKLNPPTNWMSKSRILQRQNGNYIVIWEEDKSDSTANIYFREYSESGISVSQKIRANDVPASATTEISASMDSSGNFIIVWEYGNNLKAQRFYSDLSKKGTIFQINTIEMGVNIYQHVRLHDGKIYTAWQKSERNENSIWMNILDFENPVSVENELLTPREFSLSQNYPNPFNPTTTIAFVIPNVEAQNFVPVQLKVYDVLGREVATLVNEQKPAGSYEVKFDASQLSSGIYFYRLEAGSFAQTRKMILLR